MGAKQSQLTPHHVTDVLHAMDLSEEKINKFQEIQKFNKEFRKAYPRGRLTKEDLEKLYKKTYPNGDPKIIVEEMFRVYDTDKNGTIDFREFLVGFSSINRGGTDDEKLILAFQMFDSNGDGHISKSEMHTLVKAIYKAWAYGKYDEKVADSIGSLMFQQLDTNRDNKVTLAEFLDGAKKDPSILRMFQVDLPVPHKNVSCVK